MSLGKGRQRATRTDEAAGATGGDGAALDPLSAPAAPFPTGDAFLARTIVYDDPRTNSTVQTLVSLYSNGEVEVAQRPTPGASWGPPWTLREDEGW